MSLTLTLTGNSSILTAQYFPSLDLKTDYVCGLIDFQTYNSIPNVDSKNNLFHIGDTIVKIPEGSYEINDISESVKRQLKKIHNNAVVIIKANNNTLKSEVRSTEKMFFNKKDSIGSLLGFSKRVLEPNISYESDLPVNIIRVNVIRIECNIVSGSYINNTQVHTLHEFSPKVGPGYKIIEVPKNVIYLPVNAQRIESLTLRLIDQNGDLINFRGETVTIRLHLKPQNVNI